MPSYCAINDNVRQDKILSCKDNTFFLNILKCVTILRIFFLHALDFVALLVKEFPRIRHKPTMA